jgi:hypothetical protein
MIPNIKYSMADSVSRSEVTDHGRKEIKEGPPNRHRIFILGYPNTFGLGTERIL